MQIVTLVPIARGIGREQLAYFCPFRAEIGDIATVTVKSREIKGVVVEVKDAREAKQAVRQGEFILKKVLRVEKGFIAASLVRAACETVKTSGGAVGQALGAMLPKKVLAEAEKVSKKKNLEARSPTPDVGASLTSGVFASEFVEGAREKRFEWIKKNVLKKSAEKVLYISPSNQELELAKKYFTENTQHTQDSPLWAPEGSLVCASPEYGFTWLPFVGTIILDHESGPGYLDKSAARLDFRNIYKFHARDQRQRIIFMDSILDIKYFAGGTAPDVGNSKHRVLSLSPFPKFEIAKMEKLPPLNSFLINKKLYESIQKTISKGEQMFIFSPRKGVAQTTVCGDCGEPVSCEKCGRPLELKKKMGGKLSFGCKECKKEFSSERVCVKCASWNLRPLGVTVESVANEVEKLFKNTEVIRISSDIVKTRTQILRRIKKFYETPGAILVGTELALYYLDKQINFAAIASLDVFLFSSHLDSRDKLLRVAFEVGTISKNTPLLQTKYVNDEIIVNLKSGNLKAVRAREAELLKKFNCSTI